VLEVFGEVSLLVWLEQQLGGLVSAVVHLQLLVFDVAEHLLPLLVALSLLLFQLALFEGPASLVLVFVSLGGLDEEGLFRGLDFPALLVRGEGGVRGVLLVGGLLVEEEVVLLEVQVLGVHLVVRSVGRGGCVVLRFGWGLSVSLFAQLSFASVSQPLFLFFF